MWQLVCYPPKSLHTAGKPLFLFYLTKYVYEAKGKNIVVLTIDMSAAGCVSDTDGRVGVFKSKGIMLFDNKVDTRESSQIKSTR